MKKFLLIALSIAAAATFTACSDDDKDLSITVNTAPLKSQMNSDGYWDKTYQNTTGISLDGLHFSHNSVAEWSYWTGFTPTVSTDNKEYPAEELVAHQWGAITGCGATASGDPYFVVNAESTVYSNVGADMQYPAQITIADGGDFRPVSVKITNASYGYYAMKNGSNFNKKFGQNDYCTLVITGFEDGKRTGHVEVPLAANGTILDYWRNVDLRALGEVDRMVFTMASSDTNTYDGVTYLNIPSYFCMDEFKVSDVHDTNYYK